MKKFEVITNILEKRILSGDYSLHPISSERILAEELGISHMTLRKAVQVLIDRKIMFREPNGRLSVAQQKENHHQLTIAFLMPTFMSPYFMSIFYSLMDVASKMQIGVRSVNFLHWNDPVIRRSLDGFDGVFLLRCSEPMPENVIHMLSSGKCPLVIFDEDLAEWNIPSITTCPKRSVGLLLEHLRKLGHHRIDCLNTQPLDSIMEGRIDEWRKWISRKHLQGELISDPVKSYEQPLARACDVMGNLLDTDRFGATALYCTTEPAAIGAVRAITEHKIPIGSGISVCSANDEGLSRFLTPSLTTISMPDLSPMLSKCLRWIAKGGGKWEGPLLLEPDEILLFKGESTASPK